MMSLRTLRSYLAPMAMLAAGLAIVAMLCAPALAQRRAAPPSQAAIQYSFSPIVRQAAPAVVNVYVRSRVRTMQSPFANHPIFRQFFGEEFGLPRERVLSSLGSGVIISPDGVVVTNTHVIKGRGKTEIRVALADKREFDATVVAKDEKTDIAVLKIDNGGEDFPFLDFANSDKLEVGDLVLAIGNPFGVGQTVTSGIISALTRTKVARSDRQVFIQTDAAINPGNSGGALVDMDGKLVGINTMIFSRTGGSVGIGFAIPSNLVRLYVDSALSGRKIERPWLGAKLETVTREMAEGLGLTRIAGAVIVRIANRGPASRAGLKLGDVIVRVDGFEVTDARSVRYRLTTRGVSNTARLHIIRKGSRIEIDLPLEPAPKPGREDVRNLSGKHPFDGARVSNILPGVADEFNLEETEGVVIVAVRSDGGAARLGFRPGDVIVQVGDTQVDDVVTLDEITRSPKRVWRLTIKRGGRTINLQYRG